MTILEKAMRDIPDFRASHWFWSEWRRSMVWKRKRSAYMKAHPDCEECGGRAAQVHHRTYERIPYEPDSDLEAVCRTCHPAADVRDGTRKRSALGKVPREAQHG